MQDFENFRSRIIEAMKVLNLDNSKLGRICNVSPTAIRDLVEGNSKDWGVSKLIKMLENKSELNPSWLLLGRGKMLHDTSPQESDLVKRVELLSDELEKVNDELLYAYKEKARLERILNNKTGSN